MNGNGSDSMVVSSSPAVGKNISLCNSRIVLLAAGVTHANEIKHDIHIANTLFQIKVRYKNIAAVSNYWLLSTLALSCLLSKVGTSSLCF